MTRIALGIVVALLLMLGAGSRVFRIRTIGAPTGNSARVGETVVTMMSRLEPYAPSLNRNPGNDRYTLGLLIHSTRDTTVRQFVTIVKGQQASNLGLVKITAVEGNVVWFRAPDVGAYDIARRRFLAEEPGWAAKPQEPARPFSLGDYSSGDRAILSMLIAGGYPTPAKWLGVLTEAEARDGFGAGSTLSAAYPFDRSKEPRRFYSTEIDRVDGKPRVRQLEPLGGDGMLNAAFLRAARGGDILHLAGDGFLLLYESKPYRAGSIMAARIDGTGKVVWTVDTGIGELREILPDPAFPVLIGEGPRIPDKVPEPLLVVVHASTGRLATHSLWLK